MGTVRTSNDVALPRPSSSVAVPSEPTPSDGRCSVARVRRFEAANSCTVTLGRTDRRSASASEGFGSSVVTDCSRRDRW